MTVRSDAWPEARAIFEDADDWPLAYLCQACHATWHQQMRTA
jgi:hypothetical protein